MASASLKTALAAACLVLLVLLSTRSQPSTGLRRRSSLPDLAAIAGSGADLTTQSLLHEFSSHGFVGHYPKPDVDSIASAIGAAEFFGGYALSPGPINQETAFLLSRFGADAPTRLDSGTGVTSQARIVLVDFNTARQLSPLIPSSTVAGIVDHHTLADPVGLLKPALIDIRPWGSCSSVITSYFMSDGRSIATATAGMLLGGILSDTLNLRGPTTTDADRAAARWLAARAALLPPAGPGPARGDRSKALQAATSALALEQFQAKSNLTGVPAAKVVTSDFKTYQMESGSGAAVLAAWGTLECVEPFYSRYRSADTMASLVEAVELLKKAKGLDLFFLSVVDVLGQRSYVVAVGPEERKLAAAMFTGAATEPAPGAPQGVVVSTTPRVSRKLEFVPPLRSALLA